MYNVCAWAGRQYTVIIHQREWATPWSPVYETYWIHTAKKLLNKTLPSTFKHELRLTFHYQAVYSHL